MSARMGSPQDRTTLNTLPYDLLLNIAQYLEFKDIISVQLTCKSLHDFASTRPVFRNLAVGLLRRCRALPLAGFQRLSDLTTDQLVAAVTKAIRLESAWLTRGPRPARDMSNNHEGRSSWYKVISAPPSEEVDWLSPITSSYSLCATKSGKVVCWDVQRDECLAEWDPRERWELWKCRVEFEIHTVFFTMAKVLHRSYDDRLMEFVLMKLEFPDASGEGVSQPVFTKVATFRTIGVVMNVFLLDPATRLLSAFVWVSTTNTIGLYSLLDWDKEEYVFIDTGIECSASSNWSCILHQEQIVIHSEESDLAHQYFYPLSLLQQYAKPSFGVIGISARVNPSLTMNAQFIFPAITPDDARSDSSGDEEEEAVEEEAPADSVPAAANEGTPVISPNVNLNPFPFPPWYPESAHFVRQWWPTLPTIPRLSCTVVLLADHDMESHRTRYVLAQHYFKVPLFDIHPDDTVSEGSSGSDSGYSGNSSTATGSSTSSTLVSRGDDSADSMMKIWYVSQPFEVVCILDGLDDDDEGGQPERPRPLMAVDFGHAVWVEYVDMDDKEGDESDAKRLRFVSFPPVSTAREGLSDAEAEVEAQKWTCEPAKGPEGIVRTLEIPEELNLDTVETVNIDQSQGAVIISVREGKIFILYYE